MNQLKRIAIMPFLLMGFAAWAVMWFTLTMWELAELLWEGK